MLNVTLTFCYDSLKSLIGEASEWFSIAVWWRHFTFQSWWK